MELRIKVLPNKKKESVTILQDGRYEVSVNADRKSGAANERMLTLLSFHFGVNRSDVVLKSGHTSGTKTVVVKDKKK